MAHFYDEKLRKILFFTISVKETSTNINILGKNIKKKLNKYNLQKYLSFYHIICFSD